MRIKIDGKFFNFFSSISINYALDSVASTFSLSAKFSPDNPEHQNIFLPLSYKQIEIYTNDNELLLTGYIVTHSFKSSSEPETQTISGYSKAGILEDVNIPYKLYPLEKLSVSLNDVVKNFISGFGFTYVVDPSVSSDMNLQYAKTVAQPTESIKSYLSKLAAQRNIVLGHTKQGNLLFFRPNTNSKPRVTFTQENTLSMSLSVNGQSLYSKTTVLRQPSKGNTSLVPADSATNSLVQLDREKVKILSSGVETDTRKAADNARGEALKNIALSVQLEKINFDLKCGDIVEVQNPEIYLYNKARLMVSSMAVRENQNSEAMTLSLVLPETFTGGLPKNVFAI